jgi:hypothetical protein
MKFVRAKQILVTVTAMLSLFVSAVSACACSHHEPVKQAVGSSCHGPSHESPAAEQADLLADHFEANCECFVRTPAPAIVAKTDDRRTAVEHRADDVFQASVAITIQIDPTDEAEPSFEPHRSNYQHALLASLPSRAPPRL